MNAPGPAAALKEGLCQDGFPHPDISEEIHIRATVAV
jgi:hypothetical protein